MANVPAKYTKMSDEELSEMELLRNERDAWRRLAEFLLKDKLRSDKSAKVSCGEGCHCHE